MIIVLAAVLIWGSVSRNLALAVPGDFLAWIGWLYVNPFTKCWWCRGTGRHRFGTKRTFGSCWNPRCQRGTVQRLGSKTLHRAVQALKDYRRQQRRK